MLIWIGLLLLVAGCLAYAIDRRAAHFFHDKVPRRVEFYLHRSTDWAKGAVWLQISSVGLVVGFLVTHYAHGGPGFARLSSTSLAFLVSLAIASIILHSIKIVMGRRRPRDELELGLYGWRIFRFDSRYDSFPSGHSLTIFCVAVVVSGVIPQMAWLWFAIATYLALTRTLLNSHYLSDVCVGAGMGILVTREVMLAWFPALAQSWF